jgi:hypothetical protein
MLHHVTIPWEPKATVYYYCCYVQTGTFVSPIASFNSFSASGWQRSVIGPAFF